jgi:hypothetical protein
MNNFLKVAYEQGKVAALQEAGLTKTAKSPFDYLVRENNLLRNQVIPRYLGATAAGAGVGALMDDDSALEGALAGGLGGLGLYSSPAIIDEVSSLLGKKKMPLIYDGGGPRLRNAVMAGGLGGLGGGAIGNLVDDEDSYLPEFLR